MIHHLNPMALEIMTTNSILDLIGNTPLIRLKYLHIFLILHFKHSGSFGLQINAPNSIKASTKSECLSVSKSDFLFLSIILFRSKRFSLLLREIVSPMYYASNPQA